MDVGREIRGAATQYATATDAATRTSLRARVLGLIEKLELSRSGAAGSRRVSAEELQGDASLRGAIVMHLDLMFRSSVSPAEVLFTAARGIARIAVHPAAGDFPIGVALVLPTRDLVRRRSELFEEEGPPLGRAGFAALFALATNPPRLGAAASLLHAVREDCARLERPPRLFAFSPLTGLRARVIRLVDDEGAWRRSLRAHPELAERGDEIRGMLLELLGRRAQPDLEPEPVWEWLAAEARAFARSEEYAVGNFHRSMGASLAEVTPGGDPNDSDAMWARALFDYGVSRTP